MPDERPQPIESLTEAFEELEFVNIMTYELRGRRRNGGFEDLPAADEREGDGTAELSPVQVMIRDDDSTFAVRLQLEESVPRGVVRVDLAGIFSKATPGRALAPSVQHEFVQRVAVPAIYPHLRQAVFDLAGRLGFRLMLGLLRVDSMDLTPQGQEV